MQTYKFFCVGFAFMQQHQLIVPRTARYCTLGEISDATQEIWFVCHGYGQLAPYFIKKFEAIASDTCVVVAPEALSRFYLEGFSGRVGATWMTREERVSEIDDYVRYLNLLYDTVLANKDLNSIKINVLGFSQGTATVCRWIMNQHIRYDRLVLWAGYFANGIQDVIDPALLADKEVVLVYGQNDEFLKQIDVAQYEAHIRQAIPHARVLTFAGGHTIDTEALQQI
ncbi:MAG: phospholipase [Spirosomataceae bacterium]